ncbi:TonB-dependent receptor [Halioglobus maricola]|nr:TonB-dependent receptor [Halioglobus maricola]
MIKTIHRNSNGASQPPKPKARRGHKPGFTLGLMAIGLLNAGGVATVSAQSSGATLEEVMVTAQRREQSVLDVPIAISAFSGNFLNETGIKDSMELEMVTPGLTYGRQLNGAVPFIRGVGTQTTAAGQDSSVASYIDDVYVSSSVGSVMRLANIERVEVLKGPQGTLFGRNATGGLMHLITKTPDHETQGTAELSYGNFDTLEARFYGTTGLSDNIAVDLSVLYHDQDEGWGENIPTGNDVNQGKETNIRNKWLITPGDNTDIVVSLSYADIESSFGTSMRLDEGALGVDGQLVFGGLLAQGVDPATAAGIAASQATTAPDDYWDLTADIDPEANIEQTGISINIRHQFDDIELVSITAYNDITADQSFAQDGTPFPNLLPVLLDQFTETWTQEFRISSATDNMDWIAGVYILDEEAGYDPTIVGGEFIALGSGGLLTSTQDNNQQDTFSWAVFAQADYSFTERTTLTLGLRYTEDEREISGTSSGFQGDTPLLVAQLDDEETWDEITWRIALSYDFSDDTMSYISYNRGFKSGVFDMNVLDPIGGSDNPVEPEILDAYEVGIKSEFMESRMRLSASAFYYEYDDLQVLVSVPGGTQLFNAAEATMYGAELELNALVTDNLTINAGLSYLDTEYDKFPEGPTLTPTGFGGNIQSTADLQGNELPRSPEYTFNLSAIYDVTTSIGRINASAHYYHSDSFYWESENRTEQDSYDLLNAQLTWYSNDETYYVGAYGNNLADEEYGTFGISSELGDFLSPGSPRTYGVRLGINF